MGPEWHQELQSLQFVTHLSDLSEVVNEVNLGLYASGKQVGVAELQHAIRRFNAWEESLQPYFQLSMSGPAHVVILHMYYRHLIIQYVQSQFTTEQSIDLLLQDYSDPFGRSL